MRYIASNCLLLIGDWVERQRAGKVIRGGDRLASLASKNKNKACTHMDANCTKP